MYEDVEKTAYWDLVRPIMSDLEMPRDKSRTEGFSLRSIYKVVHISEHK